MSEPAAAPVPQGGFQMTSWSFEFREIGRAGDEKVLLIIIGRAPFGETFAQPSTLTDLKLFRSKLDEAIQEAETGIKKASAVDLQALLRQSWQPPNGSHGG